MMEQPSDTLVFTVSVSKPSAGNKNNTSLYHLLCKPWTMRVICQNSHIQPVSAGLKKRHQLCAQQDEKGMLCLLKNPQQYLQEQLFTSDSV